jgi:hypothetical protein
MQKKKINIYWFIPVTITSILFGIYIGDLKFFQIKNEIDLVSFASLFITSSIGIYIASSLQKNIEANKFEKNLSLIYYNLYQTM